MPVHPCTGYQTGTLANILMNYYVKNDTFRKIRPVIRLDRDTTGIVLFAKNSHVQDQLIKQMSQGLFFKEYIAVCCGQLKDKVGTINLPIARKDSSIIERVVSPDGAPSITHYKVIKRYPLASLISLSLETGRTHQIRVHMKAIGHPLVGDTLCGNRLTELINRQALHSFKISF